MARRIEFRGGRDASCYFLESCSFWYYRVPAAYAQGFKRFRDNPAFLRPVIHWLLCVSERLSAADYFC